MKIDKVALIVNPQKEEAVEVAKVFSEWLNKKSIKVLYPKDNLKPGIGYKAEKKNEELQPKVDINSADIAITLGGDGTVLRASHLIENNNIPLLTVNFGRVGFLAEVKPENLKEAFDDVLNDEYNLIKKRMLKGIIKETKREFYALNDIIIANKGYRTLDLDVYVKESFLYSYSCDGFVIATPNGSTAYSLSLGGPIMTPNVNAKVLIPVNPHTLFNRSLIVAEDEVVKIVPIKCQIEVLADGLIIEAPDDSTVEIRLSTKFVNIIHFGENLFVEQLKERLFKL